MGRYLVNNQAVQSHSRKKVIGRISVFGSGMYHVKNKSSIQQRIKASKQIEDIPLDPTKSDDEEEPSVSGKLMANQSTLEAKQFTTLQKHDKLLINQKYLNQEDANGNRVTPINTVIRDIRMISRSKETFNK